MQMYCTVQFSDPILGDHLSDVMGNVIPPCVDQAHPDPSTSGVGASPCDRAIFVGWDRIGWIIDPIYHLPCGEMGSTVH